MNFILAVLIQFYGASKGFCDRHLIGDDFAPYAELSNVELVINHTRKPTEEIQREMIFRLRSGLIDAKEISEIKRELRE